MNDEIELLVSITNKPYKMCQGIYAITNNNLEASVSILLEEQEQYTPSSYPSYPSSYSSSSQQKKQEQKKEEKEQKKEKEECDLVRRIEDINLEDINNLNNLNNNIIDNKILQQQIEEQLKIEQQIKQQIQRNNSSQNNNNDNNEDNEDNLKYYQDYDEDDFQIHTNLKSSCNYKLLIPFYRLNEALKNIILPLEIKLEQIWTTDSLITIPGGVTCCEVSADTSDNLETFLTTFGFEFSKYQMSLCFVIDSIVKKENRQEFIIKMKTLYYDLLGIDPNEIDTKFIEEAIFRCTILYDEVDGVDTSENQLVHVITITMTGLPELLLYFQETTRSMASQFSSSNIGNGSFSCIPNDWSLLCQTVPYALILLEKDSPEWCDVLTKGGWKSKATPSRVKCIHRIENIELWRLYCSKREYIERLRGDANEQWYWHGTKSLSPEVIAKEGFDYRVANPGSYGKGAYFAHSVNYSSNGYQHSISQFSQTQLNPQVSPFPQRNNPYNQSPYPQNNFFYNQSPYPQNNMPIVLTEKNLLHNQALYAQRNQPYNQSPVIQNKMFSNRALSERNQLYNQSPHPYQNNVLQYNPRRLSRSPNTPIMSPSRRYSDPHNTSTTPLSSPRIKYPPEVTIGDTQLILARVCIGKTILLQPNSSLTRPPEGYDSVTGNTTMSIVYDLAMAYPAYIITYS